MRCTGCSITTMSDAESSIQKAARDVTQLFREKTGSDEIAQEDALTQIGRVFYKTQPISVLDLGAGIGTISYFLSQLSTEANFELYLYEVNEFCQKSLLENLNGLKFHLIKSVDELSKLSNQIDFVIIDDYINYEVTRKVLANCKPKSVFIEGHRRMQRMFVYKSFRSLNVKFMFKNFHPTPVSHKVGCVFFVGSGMSNHVSALLSIKSSLLYARIKAIQARLPLLRNLSIRSLLGK